MNILSRSLILLFTLLLAAIGASAEIEQSWRELAPNWPSHAGAVAFIKNDRTVSVQNEVSATKLVCRDNAGAFQWEYSLAVNDSVVAMLSTTDNLIYLSVYSTSLGRSYLLTLNQDGAFVWRYDYTIGKCTTRRFTEMRIFGTNILISGTGRTGLSGTDPRAVLFSLNRMTGTVNYAREYLIGGVNMVDQTKLRSAGGFAYVMANKLGNAGTAFMKVDPATGDQLVSYAVAPFYGKDIQIDSGNSVYVTGLTSPTGTAFETRRLLNATSGTFPLVYRKTFGGHQLLLSSGYVYIAEFDGASASVRKMRPYDGFSTWLRTGTGVKTFNEIRADVSGHVYALSNTSSGAGNGWGVRVIDPVGGGDLDYLEVATSNPGTNSTIGRGMVLNSYGEVLVSGDQSQGVSDDPRGLVARLYRRVEAVADTYSVIQGQTLTTTGSGLMANDKFTNPNTTFTAYVTGSGPARGVLTLLANGTFTYNTRDNSGVANAGVQTFQYRSARGTFQSVATVSITVVQQWLDFKVNTPTVIGTIKFGTSFTFTGNGPTVTATFTDNSDAVVDHAPVQLSGSNGVSFSTLEVMATTTAQVSATINGVTKTASIDILPITVSNLKFTPTTIIGGNDVLVEVSIPITLHTSHPITIDLSDDSPYLTLPATIDVPAGQTSVSFYATTSHPNVQVTAHGTASRLGKVITRSLTITP